LILFLPFAQKLAFILRVGEINPGADAINISGSALRSVRIVSL